MDTTEKLNNFVCATSFSCKKIKATRKLQELAAELMTVDDKTNALKLYNRSIAVSPIYAVDLPIAYANKSAVLLEMKSYDSCLKNINLALKHPLCPVWLVSALLERKIKCLLLMGRWNEHTEKKLVKTVRRLPFSNNEKSVLRIRLTQYLQQIYNVIKSTDEKRFRVNTYAYKKSKKKLDASDGDILYLSDHIEFVQNRKYGRHIIAKCDIDMGDILLKEKAVVSCLYLNEVYDYCSHCLTRTHVLMPCHHCSKALFCSKYCMAKAVEHYHGIECPLMEYFVSLEPEDQHVQYILRLLCFLSNQGRKLDELIEKWSEWKNKEKSYPSNTKIYEVPDNFQSLFLSFDKYSYQPLQFVHSQSRYSKLVEKLKEKTDLFIYLGSTAYEHYFEYMITSLLIDLEAYFKCNSFCVSDSVYSSDDELTVMRKNIGLACYRETNFFNHSCVPNAAYGFENGDTVATYSLRKIRAGEQIFICYLNTYYETDKRNRDLAKSYSFQCRCVACEENWPPFQYLQSVYDIRFCECEHHNALYRRISITGCSFCRFKHDLALSLKTIRDRLASGRPFLSIVENLRLDIVEAMDLFQSLEGIEVHLIKEYVELYRLFCQCIEIAGNVNFN